MRLAPLLASIGLLAGAAALASACTTNAATAGTGATGPGCLGAGGATVNPTCDTCDGLLCARDVDGVQAACATFLACEAKCSCTDSTCTAACAATIDASCRSALSDTKACESAWCASECAGDDTSEAGATTASCEALSGCCATLPGSIGRGCASVVVANHDTICASQLTSYRASGLCVTTGSPVVSCEKLSLCCAMLTDAGAKAACTAQANAGDDALCTALDATLNGNGSCGVDAGGA